MTREAPAETTSAPPEPPRLTPVVANRAILVYLLAASAMQTLFVAAFGAGVGLAVLAGGVATLVLLVLFFPGAWRELTRSSRWRTPPDLLTALGAFGLGLVASRAFAVFIQAAFPGAGKALQDYNLQLTSSSADLAVLLFAGGLLIPFVEELVFRGFGLAGYERYRRAGTAALLTSVLFALVHLVPAQAAAVFPLGWVIARAVQFSGSFWTGVVVHAANNLMSLGLLALLTSLPDFEGLMREGSQVRPTLPMGFAALGVAVLALAIALAWLKPRDPGARQRGPVWSWSLLVPLGLFAMVAFGVDVSRGLRFAAELAGQVFPR